MNRIQAAKDSLYVALRDRLESANPGRIAQIGGATRIAIAMQAALSEMPIRGCQASSICPSGWSRRWRVRSHRAVRW